MDLMNSKIMFGHLMHTRKKIHQFRFRHYFFALDLDELESIGKHKLFGWNKGWFFSFLDQDYLGQTTGSIKSKLNSRLSNLGIDIGKSTVLLVTTPRFIKHTFNPVNFYYCYTSTKKLEKVIVEVNNTFGEAHLYVLDNLIEENGYFIDSHAKLFHVSPMNNMEGEYTFYFTDILNTNHLDLGINLQNMETPFFTSRFIGDAINFSDRSLLWLGIRYTLSTFLALPRILIHAGILHYIKKLPIFSKPDPSSEMTYTSTYKPYINEFKK